MLLLIFFLASTVISKNALDYQNELCDLIKNESIKQDDHLKTMTNYINEFDKECRKIVSKYSVPVTEKSFFLESSFNILQGELRSAAEILVLQRKLSKRNFGPFTESLAGSLGRNFKFSTLQKFSNSPVLPYSSKQTLNVAVLSTAMKQNYTLGKSSPSNNLVSHAKRNIGSIVAKSSGRQRSSRFQSTEIERRPLLSSARDLPMLSSSQKLSGNEKQSLLRGEGKSDSIEEIIPNSEKQSLLRAEGKSDSIDEIIPNSEKQSLLRGEGKSDSIDEIIPNSEKQSGERKSMGTPKARSDAMLRANNAFKSFIKNKYVIFSFTVISLAAVGTGIYALVQHYKKSEE